MALHQSHEGAVVPLAPVCRRRRHDDLTQAVLEQQPAARRASQRLRREMRRRPGAGQSLLAQRPDAATLVADLAREGDVMDTRIRIGTIFQYELVAWRDDRGWVQDRGAGEGRQDGPPASRPTVARCVSIVSLDSDFVFDRAETVSTG
jgi:hypothetical protein